MSDITTTKSAYVQSRKDFADAELAIARDARRYLASLMIDRGIAAIEVDLMFGSDIGGSDVTVIDVSTVDGGRTDILHWNDEIVYALNDTGFVMEADGEGMFDIEEVLFDLVLDDDAGTLTVTLAPDAEDILDAL